jgi:hypothetical protein
MEARFPRAIPAMAVLIGLTAYSASSTTAHAAAGYRTTNFVVSAPTPQLAKEIGDTAEECRKRLAIEWLGQEMPPWSRPCPIHAQLASGAGGATSFVFNRGEVYDWKMNIQGSRERLLDSVLPHEVTHTIFASHFRRPLPRWADEGACTTVEHRSEVAKQERMLIEFLKTNRGIPFSRMFAMKDYPPDVMPLYAQGHSLAQWLIESRGRKVFLDFLADGMSDENWPRAIYAHYGFDNLLTMQSAWNEWVKEGRPHLTPETSPITQLVARTQATGGGIAATPAVYRGQSPDPITPIPGGATSRPLQNAPVTVASASGSVYARAAARPTHPRRNARAAADRRNRQSIYDASRDTGVLRR